MQISFFAKVVLFLTLYCISDLSLKNNIERESLRRFWENFSIIYPIDELSNLCYESIH